MLKKTMFAVICAVALCATNLTVEAKSAKNAPATTGTNSAKTEETTPAASTRPIPYYGKIGMVDKANKTFTIQGKKSTRTFTATDSTKMEKAGGGAATWEDLKAGEYVRGSATKKGEGQYMAMSVKIGPKEQKASTSQPQSKSKKQ